MKLLNKEGQELEKLDLGIVKAGEKKEYSYILYNNVPRNVIDIKVSVNHDEVEISNVPEGMTPDSRAEIKIVWSPTLAIKKGLKTLIKVSAAELYE